MNMLTFPTSCLLALIGMTTTATSPDCAFADEKAPLQPTKEPFIAASAPPTAPPAPAPVPPPPLAGGGGGFGGRVATTQELERRVAEAAARAQAASVRAAEAASRQEFQFKTGEFLDANGGRLLFGSQRQTPALVSTREMNSVEKSEWGEDLIVMDKLLRDQMKSLADDDEVLAMGIRVTVPFLAAPPMYVEGAGALFTLSTSIPLAASDKASTAPTTREALSAWDRAKRELVGKKFDAKPAQPPQFSQSAVDALVSSMSRTLREAANMRHLAPEESVIITITGADDAGVPRRLNIKARKSDIDDAVKGDQSPETFRKLIASNIT